jgi:hypothetical protein
VPTALSIRSRLRNTQVVSGSQDHTCSRSTRQDSPPRPLRGCTKKDTKNTKRNKWCPWCELLGIRLADTRDKSASGELGELGGDFLSF